MRGFNSIRTRLFGGLMGMTLALAGAGAGTAKASDYDCPPACRVVTVTTYVDRDVTYTKVVTVYDSCGRAYQVLKTCHATVTVPVTKRVLVCE